MKWYGIDEDIYIALVDLLGEARAAAEHVGDDDSVTYYTFLLGELEDAKKYNKLGKSKKMDDEQNARMMKLQRYLRMLQEGLRDPKDLNKKPIFENKGAIIFLPIFKPKILIIKNKK